MSSLASRRRTPYAQQPAHVGAAAKLEQPSVAWLVWCSASFAASFILSNEKVNGSGPFRVDQHRSRIQDKSILPKASTGKFVALVFCLPEAAHTADRDALGLHG